MLHRGGYNHIVGPSLWLQRGGDQVPDGAVDEEFLLADNYRDGGDPCGGWVYHGARSHDGSMPCRRHARRIDRKAELTARRRGGRRRRAKPTGRAAGRDRNGTRRQGQVTGSPPSQTRRGGRAWGHAEAPPWAAAHHPTAGRPPRTIAPRAGA